ncbi:conserved hypothetical protein, partial [Ricinus communis]
MGDDGVSGGHDHRHVASRLVAGAFRLAAGVYCHIVVADCRQRSWFLCTHFCRSGDCALAARPGGWSVTAARRHGADALVPAQYPGARLWHSDCGDRIYASNCAVYQWL